MKRVVSLLFLVSGLGIATLACADQPKLFCSAFSEAFEPASVYTLPDGSGDGFASCYSYGGVPIDATIIVTLMDEFGNPVANFPREDIWLGTPNSGIVICQGHGLADDNTDPNGMTTFSLPIHGGGAAGPELEDPLWVILNGEACSPVGLDIYVNSPDVNGDLVVDLVDVVLFAQMYFNQYSYDADFHWDGVLNLADIVLLSRGMGAECP